MLKLGLIGDNIAASHAPALHRACGHMVGMDVSYDRFIPAEMGMEFDALFDDLAERGLTGINITLPYKERALARTVPADPAIARIGAVNTVLFEGETPTGHNTDFTGFVAAWREAFGQADPGRVVVFGAGGVGRAVAFGLEQLGADEVILIDPDRSRSDRLAQAVTDGGRIKARSGTLVDLDGADGVVNCSPLGMVGYGGSAVPEGRFPPARWAFDAVYTPVDTPFSQQAREVGAAFLSGYELFFHQGVDAFALFSGKRIVDHAALRAALANESE